MFEFLLLMQDHVNNSDFCVGLYFIKHLMIKSCSKLETSFIVLFIYKKSVNHISLHVAMSTLDI